MSSEAKRQLFWVDGTLKVQYLGLYFIGAYSLSESYFELGRLQLKDVDGNDINLYDGSSYVGYGPLNNNSTPYDDPGNGCKYRNHETDPNETQNKCMRADDTVLIGYAVSPANKKFPFLAPFKLGCELNLSVPLFYTQRAGRNSTLSSRKITQFALMASQDSKYWFELAHYANSTPPTVDYVKLINNQKIEIDKNLVDLSMFVKMKD